MGGSRLGRPAGSGSNDDEASTVPLPKRPNEVPEIYRPIVLAQISFPAADKMIMRFRAVERAIAAGVVLCAALRAERGARSVQDPQTAW